MPCGSSWADRDGGAPGGMPDAAAEVPDVAEAEVPGDTREGVEVEADAPSDVQAEGVAVEAEGPARYRRARLP